MALSAAENTAVEAMLARHISAQMCALAVAVARQTGQSITTLGSTFTTAYSDVTAIQFTGGGSQTTTFTDWTR